MQRNRNEVNSMSHKPFLSEVSPMVDQKQIHHWVGLAETVYHWWTLIATCGLLWWIRAPRSLVVKWVHTLLPPLSPPGLLQSIQGHWAKDWDRAEGWKSSPACLHWVYLFPQGFSANFPLKPGTGQQHGDQPLTVEEAEDWDTKHWGLSVSLVLTFQVLLKR